MDHPMENGVLFENRTPFFYPKYLATIGILRPIPKALPVTRSIGGV